VYAVTRHKEIDMRNTLTRIIMAVLAIATATALATPPASAGDDLPHGTSGVIADSVMVTGRITANGYSGGWFNRERHTEYESFIGSATFDVGDGPTALTRDDGCSGDFEYLVETAVWERREDGAVQVSVLVDTWDECPGQGWNDGFSQPYEWVAPGETLRIDVPVRSSNGSIVVSATFTNYWTPKIDLVTPLITIPWESWAFDF